MRQLPLVLASVLLLAGCAANSHLEKVGPNTWRYDYEFYRPADPQILVDVYRSQENITKKQWDLRHESSGFTVIPGHPEDFDGHVTQVKVYLDNSGPVFAIKKDTGYRFEVTTGPGKFYGSFGNLTPGYHTLVVQMEWEVWKPYWYKGRPTRDFTTCTWCEILVDQSHLARFQDDPGIYDAGKKEGPQLLVKEQGMWVNVTDMKRRMFDNTEEYAVTVGKGNGYVQSVIAYVDNIQVPVRKRGIYYTFGVSTGHAGRGCFNNISAGTHRLMVGVIRTINPEPTPPPFTGEGGQQSSAVAHSILDVDYTRLSH